MYDKSHFSRTVFATALACYTHQAYHDQKVFTLPSFTRRGILDQDVHKYFLVSFRAPSTSVQDMAAPGVCQAQVRGNEHPQELCPSDNSNDLTGFCFATCRAVYDSLMFS